MNATCVLEKNNSNIFHRASGRYNWKYNNNIIKTLPSTVEGRVRKKAQDAQVSMIESYLYTEIIVYFRKQAINMLTLINPN